MNSHRPSGFSLIESLVALLLVTVALFLALHLTTTQPRVIERLRAHEAALRAVEASIETLRGGSIPLVEGRSRLVAQEFFLPDPAADSLQMTLDVVASPSVEDLFAVTVEARYLAAERVHVRRVQTLMWRP